MKKSPSPAANKRPQIGRVIQEIARRQTSDSEAFHKFCQQAVDTGNLLIEKHNQERKAWRLGFLDLFRPKTLFNKILKRVLYPIKLVQPITNELEALCNQGIPIRRYLAATGDNFPIELWFAKSDNPEARTKFYLHGNASNIACFSEQAAKDFQEGNNIVLCTYRGYSRKGLGLPSEQGLIADLNSSIDFIHQHTHIPTERMDFVAHSLGAAVTLNTLAQRVSNNSQEKFGHVTLLAPFKSMRDMVKVKTTILPRFLINRLTNIWNNSEALPKLKNNIQTLTIVHGTADQVIPIEQGRELYEQARRSTIDSEFIEKRDADHSGVLRYKAVLA